MTGQQVQEVVKALQRDLIKLYRSGPRANPLNLLAKDNCSEASRLMAIWIKRKVNNAEFFILKGEYKPSKYHDVLLLQLGSEFYLIDPTIWQFFKYKRSILLRVFNSTPDALTGAKQIYGGRWESLERISSFKNELGLIRIIRENVN